MRDADPDLEALAGALLRSIGLLRRTVQQTHIEADLTLGETSALARLDRAGPTTAAALARLEQISPQSMGATLAALADRGLIERVSDPTDGRRALISVTHAGLEILKSRRSARARQVAAGLSNGFSRTELKQLHAAAPLIERLALSM